jgi:RNA polymerase-binding transcription factor DksA
MKKPAGGKSKAQRASKPAKKSTPTAKKSNGRAKAAVAMTRKPMAKTAAAKSPAKSAPRDTISKTTKAKESKSAAVARPAMKSPSAAKSAPSMKSPPPMIVTPANGKPRKNAAGFNARELDHFREQLLAKRRELLGDLRSMEHEALHSGGGSNLSNLPIHMADMGTDNYEQEFTLGLVEKDRQVLREINAALVKIQGGTYGICEGTGKPINRERLEYQPWARYSIEYARKLERAGRPGGVL